MQEKQDTWFRSLGWEDPLKNEVANHSSILAWRIPWTEEPGGLQSIGPQRVRYDWSNLASMQRIHKGIPRKGKSQIRNQEWARKFETNLEHIRTWAIRFLALIYWYIHQQTKGSKTPGSQDILYWCVPSFVYLWLSLKVFTSLADRHIYSKFFLLNLFLFFSALS